MVDPEGVAVATAALPGLPALWSIAFLGLTPQAIDCRRFAATTFFAPNVRSRHTARAAYDTPMTRGKQTTRKTNRLVRLPATKFPKIQKRLSQARIPVAKPRKPAGH